VSSHDGDRAQQLAAIRATYARYADSGRDRIWSNENRGFRRLLQERDARLLELVRASLPAGGAVLDAGCGRGELASLIHEHRPDVAWTGIDLLDESIAAAREAAPWARWVVGSADDIPVPDGSIDVAVAVTLFSSLPSAALERAVAAELARVLKPGGWLIWYDLRHNSPGNNAVHGLDRHQVSRLFPGWQSELETATLVPPIARRLGSFVPVVYPLLSAIPLLRSHLLGRLRRPPRPVSPSRSDSIGSRR
jgi:SAM-dependent methyltransferase